MPPAAETEDAPQRHSCCPFFHEAIELIGRRWSGAIIQVLMDGPLRFSEVASSVPEISDRLLSERMKELEARGIVERTVHPGPPVRVQYSLSEMGLALEPALAELKSWAVHWLGDEPEPGHKRVGEPERTHAPQPERTHAPQPEHHPLTAGAAAS